MSDPLPLGKTMSGILSAKAGQIQELIKNSKKLSIAVFALFFGLMPPFLNTEMALYAQADTAARDNILTFDSPLFEQQEALFKQKIAQQSVNVPVSVPNVAKAHPQKTDATLSSILGEQQTTVFEPKNGSKKSSRANEQFAQKLYAIVGDAPIKEMVPMISKRDEKVAAFLVGIAKKESSFGLASPSKDGQTCFNYWGYKGSGGRGTGMGYACFASADEAVETVGNRIQTLVEKDRSTPSRMVDTWKCGTSCAGDPGAPGWVSTVALYFEKIVG